MWPTAWVYPLPASQGETVPVAVGILGVHPPPVVGRIVRIVPTGIQTESRTEVQCDVVHLGFATAVYVTGLEISCRLRVLLYIRHVFAGVSQVYAAVLVEVVFSKELTVAGAAAAATVSSLGETEIITVLVSGS